jgi:hypothetical protein
MVQSAGVPLSVRNRHSPETTPRSVRDRAAGVSTPRTRTASMTRLAAGLRYETSLCRSETIRNRACQSDFPPWETRCSAWYRCPIAFAWGFERKAVRA